ncbi:site-2 protease family protein [Gottschalkia purinilytica]|nr:site-2 protease family protein [Gottschalkia purinilytica]
MYILKLNNIRVKLNYIMLIPIIIYFYFGYFIEIVLMFILILFHELAHIFVASKYGVKIGEVELFVFGGVAKSESLIGHDPNTEIIISIAGPLFNFCLMLLFMIIEKITSSYLTYYMIKANSFICFFNLLPLFPLDGGKILRAFLSNFFGVKNSTRYLTRLTYILCVFIIIISIYCLTLRQSIYIIILSIFILIAANKESKMAAFIFMKNITGKKWELRQRKIMKTHLLVCLKTVTAEEIFNCFLPNKYHVLIVIDNKGKCLGTISECDLIEGVIDQGLYTEVEKLLNNN